MDHSNAEGIGVFRRSDRDFLSVYKNLTAVRVINAGEHIHKSGLSASVFPQEGKDLTFSDGERDVFIRGDNAEIFANTF